MNPAYWAALWLDDYSGEFGIYEVFTDYRKCIDYLVDTVFERAENLDVEVLDLDGDPVLRDHKVTLPLMERSAVRRVLEEKHNFSLGLKFGHFMQPEHKVTVGIREVKLNHTSKKNNAICRR